MPAVVSFKEAYRITGVGVVVAGEVRSGVLRPGMALESDPSVIVKSIECNHSPVNEASPGVAIGFGLSGDFKAISALKGSDVGFKEGSPGAIHPKGFLSRLFGR